MSTNTSRMAYYSVYLAAVQYPLTASYMSKKALDWGQVKATRRLFRRLRFNKNMPMIVAYVPRMIGGLGMQRLYTTQCMRNTMQLLKHLCAGTTVGKLFKIGIDWFQRVRK